jgi:hypothetical protein
MYDELARGSNWKTVECFDFAKQVIRPADEISAEVLAAVLPCIERRQKAKV